MPGQSAMPAAGGSSAAVHVLSARLGEGPAARAAASLPGLEADEVAAARVSVDGETMCGAVQADGRAVHLLAAMSGGGAVLAQREVGHKTNEITQVKPLLEHPEGWHMLQRVFVTDLDEERPKSTRNGTADANPDSCGSTSRALPPGCPAACAALSATVSPGRVSLG